MVYSTIINAVPGFQHLLFGKIDWKKKVRNLVVFSEVSESAKI
jgi:hypothetical protein